MALFWAAGAGAGAGAGFGAGVGTAFGSGAGFVACSGTGAGLCFSFLAAFLDTTAGAFVVGFGSGGAKTERLSSAMVSSNTREIE